MNKQKYDFIIIGGGIIGLTLAYHLVKKKLGSILILEKESDIGCHASGRNSGVLHAGIYYKPDTLKAQLCLHGNQLLYQFCKANQLPLVEKGKVLVISDKDQEETLLELHDNARQTGADVSLISEQQLHNIEPFAKTVKTALYSKNTYVTQPKLVLESLRSYLRTTKTVTFRYNQTFDSLINDTTFKTKEGSIYTFTKLINAAGTFSDKIAHEFKLGLQYSLVPFKGIYKKLSPKKAALINGNIYPVPNLKFPFLGVHFTKNPAGEVYVGPTAFPVFLKEGYTHSFSYSKESCQLLIKNMRLFLFNTKFRNLCFDEPKKYIPAYFYKSAAKLVQDLSPEDLIPSEKSGIRAQLVNWQTHQLEMDFIIESNRHSTHILNAISPAFTSSFAFSDYIIENFVLSTKNKGKKQ